MRTTALLSILLLSYCSYSQEAKKETAVKTPRLSFVKLDISFPLRVNQYAGEIDPYTGEKEPWFLADGLSARFGYGLKPLDWLGFVANFGVDWKGSKCLVVAPVFASVKICPKIGEDARLTIEPGFGRALALGRSDLAGYFKKLSLGMEDIGNSGVGLYLELCQYGFNRITEEKIGSFCVGMNYIFK